ncbi:MAG TPA: hypothetical protein VML55_24530 [Planctomycetaceae bacterium]|nr:hypothetical protein [Planctomycetaceae bacterium]
MRFLTCLLTALAVAATGTARAQTATVQQPVLRVFSATTTVSVPDRGSAFLAGVGRAADSRSRFGPLQTSSSAGMSREHAGMNIGARILDFDELDRQALGQGAAARGERAGPLLTGYAAHSYRHLHVRLGARETGALASSSAAPPDPAAKADRYYRLGLDAEERGSAGVAKLHYRTAVRHGSAAAGERLARLGAAGGADVAQR